MDAVIARSAITQRIVQVVMGCCVLWVSLFLGWQSMRAADFGYPILYDILDIDAQITQYGPQNRYKHEFAATDRAERERLFHEIVVAIHDGGRGLSDIRYHHPDGKEIDVFLRAPEVVHLEDVARLLDRLTLFTGVVAAVGLTGVALVWFFNTPLMGTLRILMWIGGVVGVSSIAIVLIGAKEVFYYLHTVIFPADHQWFFYYQESLMTTLMKAPTIFGPIAVAVVFASLLWFWCLWFAVGRVLQIREKKRDAHDT